MDGKKKPVMPPVWTAEKKGLYGFRRVLSSDAYRLAISRSCQGLAKYTL